MNVSATAMPVARQNSRSAGAPRGAHDAVAGQGHRVDGVADEVGGLEQLAGRGLGLDRPAARQRRGVDVGAAMTSSGSSRWVAPGFSDSATLKALRTTSGMISGLATRAFHFVMGRNSSTRSMN